MTLRRAMDDICHQAHKHQSGLCAQAGAGAIGFDSKGDNLGIIVQFALPMRYPAPANSLSPTPADSPSPTQANPPSPTITSQPTPARPARVIRRPSRFATDSPLLIPPPPNTPFLPSSLSRGSASASPSTPPIQGPEAASKDAACSASPNYPAACASSISPPPPAPHDLLMRVIKADVELGRRCQASWSAQFQLDARELMGGEFTLSPDMVLGTKAMEVKWLESHTSLLNSHACLQPHQLLTATSATHSKQTALYRAGTSLVANLKHISVTLATWDAVWEVYLDPKWARQQLRLYGAQDRALEQFFEKLEEVMADVGCMCRRWWELVGRNTPGLAASLMLPVLRAST
ncbi:hypothetical protein QJQ45_010906 [Haematococcus lacustris]|nr:hypothetical protein QJQ45_010906 [Haematococcus lacustris]